MGDEVAEGSGARFDFDDSSECSDGDDIKDFIDELESLKQEDDDSRFNIQGYQHKEPPTSPKRITTAESIDAEKTCQRDRKSDGRGHAVRQSLAERSVVRRAPPSPPRERGKRICKSRERAMLDRLSPLDSRPKRPPPATGAPPPWRPAASSGLERETHPCQPPSRVSRDLYADAYRRHAESLIRSSLTVDGARPPRADSLLLGRLLSRLRLLSCGSVCRPERAQRVSDVPELSSVLDLWRCGDSSSDEFDLSAVESSLIGALDAERDSAFDRYVRQCVAFCMMNGLSSAIDSESSIDVKSAKSLRDKGNDKVKNKCKRDAPKPVHPKRDDLRDGHPSSSPASKAPADAEEEFARKVDGFFPDSETISESDLSAVLCRLGIVSRSVREPGSAVEPELSGWLCDSSSPSDSVNTHDPRVCPSKDCASGAGYDVCDGCDCHGASERRTGDARAACDDDDDESSVRGPMYRTSAVRQSIRECLTGRPRNDFQSYVRVCLLVARANGSLNTKKADSSVPVCPAPKKVVLTQARLDSLSQPRPDSDEEAAIKKAKREKWAAEEEARQSFLKKRQDRQERAEQARQYHGMSRRSIEIVSEKGTCGTLEERDHKFSEQRRQKIADLELSLAKALEDEQHKQGIGTHRRLTDAEAAELRARCENHRKRREDELEKELKLPFRPVVNTDLNKVKELLEAPVALPAGWESDVSRRREARQKYLENKQREQQLLDPVGSSRGDFN